MVKIEGLFKCNEIKEFKNSKKLSLSNSDKDKDGNFKNTYYDLWLTEKVSNMVNPELKKKMVNKGMINIKGWLKVTKTNNYQNLTIYPSEITEYIKKANY